jgi:hypothetical protein
MNTGREGDTHLRATSTTIFLLSKYKVEGLRGREGERERAYEIEREKDTGLGR